jgi:hypothetical protein
MSAFTLPTRETTTQDLRQATLDLVIQCNLLIRMVDSTAFQKLIKLIRALGAINRKQISQDITNTYLSRKIEIQSILSYHRDNGLRFILCIDC